MGSLSPTFVSARRVGLAVKRACAFTLYGWFPFSLSTPLGASVTFLEATAPVKLPAWHGSLPSSWVKVRVKTSSGWYFSDDSPEPRSPGSKSPTYATHESQKHSIRLQLRFTGSFRPAAGNRYLRRYCNFTESLVETVPNSLCLSCRSELTRQGISLP